MEGIVIEMFAIFAAGLAVGVVIGGIILVSVGIRREEAAHTLTISTSDRIARCARIAAS